MSLATRRLRAPQVDGGLLAEPPLAETDRLLASNRSNLSNWDYDVQGRSLHRLRASARLEIMTRSRQYLQKNGLDDLNLGDGPASVLQAGGPFVVTGHQPELFHPGVWIKNFAASNLGQRLGGIGLNLIIDNDIPKALAVRVPFRSGSVLKARYEAFDRWSGEIPYEDLRVQDEQMFAGFADRVRPMLEGLVPNPLLEIDWPRAVAAGDLTDRLGLRLSAMRRRRESDWGIRNAELPLSMLCESEVFHWFAAHLIAHSDRFQEVYNQALKRYRALYGIRSKNHPVPELQTEDDWREVPFWAWRREHPRRRPLMVRQVNPKEIQLRIGGEDTPLLTLPLGPDQEACCAVERLRELAAQGVRLRTRAITTTMFARMFVADLFIHGIGGAKYDELGDEIFRDFFKNEPPAYQTLSMTLWPQLPDDSATDDQLRRVESTLRDLRYNPDRFLTNPVSEDVRKLVLEKQSALQSPQTTRQQRIARFFAIRRVNDQLGTFVEEKRHHFEIELERVRAGLERNSIAHSREFASVLHPADHLRRALTQVFPR